MVTDAEKNLLLDWQRWNAFFDMMNSMGLCEGPNHDKIVEGYYRAIDQIKTIKDERFAALVKAACEDRPEVELTFEGWAQLKVWKERTDAARKQLETASLEFGNNLPFVESPPRA